MKVKQKIMEDYTLKNDGETQEILKKRVDLEPETSNLKFFRRFGVLEGERGIRSVLGFERDEKEEGGGG